MKGFVNSIGVVLAVFCVVVFSSFVRAEVFIQYGDRFHPAVSAGGMVVSQEQVASHVGAEILSRGGNAIDAAVATGYALAVTLPQAGNIGGGGFMLIYLAEQDKTIAIDYREMAPAAAHRDLFLGSDGNVDQQLARFSRRSAGIPGSVAGLNHVLEQYGTLSLREVMQPAIDLADKGIRVSHPLAFSLRSADKRLRADAAAQRYFFDDDGHHLQIGTLWRQADLARTLRRIADKGTDEFYRGETAKLLIEEMQRGGGLITLEDLANYRVIEREPVMGSYRGYQVASMPPPSSGGVHLIQMLNILEGWDLQSLGHNSAGYLHRLIETMRRAYADRSEYLGDPDFYPVPVKALTEKDYAQQLRNTISLTQASSSDVIRPALKLREESPQTTHFSVWDKQGNVVSNTYTLNFSFGSGIAVEGAGFLLNNEMDDFSAKPGVPNAFGLVGGEANAIEGGKRPLSSMTPTLVFQHGKPVIATGSPGGSTIITVVLQQLLNIIDFDMNLAEATAAPRIHHQWLPDKTWLEQGISADTEQLLNQKGHVTARQRVLGRTQSLMKNGDVLFGVSDYRWPGGGAVPDQ